MTPAITLEQFAEVVATSEDDQWASHLIEAARALLPETKEAALFLLREQGLTPIAASSTPPVLAETLLQQLPRRVGRALLLPIPAFPNALLWLKTSLRAEEAQRRLGGWLAIAGLGLSRYQQQKEAERQRTARDHFFSMVNHDLKSPLSSVKAMADLLLRKLQRGTLDPTTQEGRADLLERLTFLSRRVKDLAQLIDEIGDVSCIERGRLELNLQPTELTSILRSSIEQLEAEKPGRSVAVQFPEHPVLVQVDPFRVLQLFYILLKNAMDYSEPGTPVRVRLHREAENVHVEIEDEGRGIAVEQQARLFQEYGRAVQQMPSGLGVGLYIASALVSAHGGTLGLESTPNSGTTVRLLLPLREKEEKQAQT